MVSSLKVLNVNSNIFALNMLLLIVLFSPKLMGGTEASFDKLIIGKWGESENNGESFWSVYEYFEDYSLKVKTILPDAVTEVISKGTYSINNNYICSIVNYSSHPKLISIGEKSCIELTDMNDQSFQYHNGFESIKLYRINNTKSFVNLVNFVPDDKAQNIKYMIESSGGVHLSHSTIMKIKKEILSKIEMLNPKLSNQNIKIIEKNIVNLIEREATIDGDLLKLITIVYHKYFTHEEIVKLLKFYNSPIGKKLTELSPALIREASIAKLGLE